MKSEKPQIETVRTPGDAPRFNLQVCGVQVRVTRHQTDEDGWTYFELADAQEQDLRSVFPTDYGRIKDGHVYMRVQDWDETTEQWVNTDWEYVGGVEYSALRVGDSVRAELAELRWSPSPGFDNHREDNGGDTE